MMRGSVVLALAGVVALACLAAGSAVADEQVIELKHADAAELVTWLTFHAPSQSDEESAIAGERAEAAAFGVDVMQSFARPPWVLSDWAPPVADGARPVPTPAIRGIAQATAGQCLYLRPPQPEDTAAGAASLLPDGIELPLTIVPGRNAIAVRGTADAIDALREIFALLDSPPKRVQLQVSLHEVTGEEFEARAPATDKHTFLMGGQLRLAILDTDALLDGGGLGRTLAHAGASADNGHCVVASLAQIVPMGSAIVSYDAEGVRTADLSTEAAVAGACIGMAPQVMRDNDMQFEIGGVGVGAQGRTDGVKPEDIEVSDLWHAFIHVRPGESLVIEVPSVVERWNALCEERGIPQSRITQDLRAAIVITPTVIVLDEGDDQ